MNLVLLFQTNIDLTWELSSSLRKPLASVKSDVVEFPLMLTSTPSWPMTASQAPVRPSSPAELGTKRGRLDFWLLTIEGALAFDLYSGSCGSKVFGEDGACIFRASECFIFLWSSAYAFSFLLPSFVELWRDPRCWSAFIILVRLWLFGHWCFGRQGYGWSEVAFLAALLRWWLSWLPLLLLWLLRLRLFAVRLDFWIGGAVEKSFYTVKFSVLWGQRLDLGPKSWW